MRRAFRVGNATGQEEEGQHVVKVQLLILKTFVLRDVCHEEGSG